MNTEPELEQLSAYVDQELTGTSRQELEEHLKGCETCRRRLEALRQTVGAIRALPQETPPRTFTIPAQRRQAFRWLPTLAWAGGAAAAAVIVVSVGISLSHLPRGGGAASAPAGGGILTLNKQGTQPAQGNTDRAYSAALPAVNQVTVTDSRNPSRMLMLGTDSRSYRASDGTMNVQLHLAGVPAGTNLDRQVRLILSRGAQGVELPSRSWVVDPASGRASSSGRYELGSLRLPDPRAGAYRLMAIWTDASAATLIGEVPVDLS
jgi:hypothetical protein